MQEKSEGVIETLYKMIALAPGVILGLSAKLSKLNRDRKLNLREGIYHATVALSSASVIYFVLKHYHYESWAWPAGVICGRYGDEMIIFIWRWTKITVQTFLKTIK